MKIKNSTFGPLIFFCRDDHSDGFLVYVPPEMVHNFVFYDVYYGCHCVCVYTPDKQQQKKTKEETYNIQVFA